MPKNPLGILLRNRRAGHKTLAWAHPDLQGPEAFTLSSPAFPHGAPIPARHRGRIRGANLSPVLAWTAPPPGTRELVLVLQDPDVPFRKPAIHAITVGISPTARDLPEGALSSSGPIIPGLRHGRAGLGRRGYSGPMPLRSHGPHTYVFQLFALDRRLEIPNAFTFDDAREAMAGHVIARARLDGTYESR